MCYWAVTFRVTKYIPNGISSWAQQSDHSISDRYEDVFGYLQNSYIIFIFSIPKMIVFSYYWNIYQEKKNFTWEEQQPGIRIVKLGDPLIGDKLGEPYFRSKNYPNHLKIR